jgi:hypothetical protein
MKNEVFVRFLRSSDLNELIFGHAGVACAYKYSKILHIAPVQSLNLQKAYL